MTHQQTLGHAVPTSDAEDPKLAFIVEVWDWLTNERKLRLVEIV
jgi:hypothetical protein